MIDQRMKRCPFCGCYVEIFEDMGTYEQIVSCRRCGISFYFNTANKEKAIEKWNRRAKNDT